MVNQNKSNQLIRPGKIIQIIDTIEQLLTSILKTVSQLIIKLFQFFTPAIAPAPTAGLFGVNIYMAMETQVTILWIRQGIAITLALSLEGAGFLALKSAVRFYYLWRQERKHTEYLYIAVAISILYIMIGIGSTILLENISRDLRLLGITAFLIAPLVYAAASLWDELEIAIAEVKEANDQELAQQLRVEQKEAETEAHQREVENRDRAFQQQVELEKLRHQQTIELQKQTAKEERLRLKEHLAGSSSPQHIHPQQNLPSPSHQIVESEKTHICAGCHKKYSNYRSLNGHKRTCELWKQHKRAVQLNQANGVS